MKTLKYFLLLIAFSIGINAYPQKKSKTDTITIKTSAQCDMCKDRIEKVLAYTKGVKNSNLEVESKIITVIYKPSKITPEKIREAISKAGYDADTVLADPGAYENLPGCCKKGGH